VNDCWIKWLKNNREFEAMGAYSVAKWLKYKVFLLFPLFLACFGCSVNRQDDVSVWLGNHSNEQISYKHVILDAKIKQ